MRYVEGAREPITIVILVKISDAPRHRIYLRVLKTQPVNRLTKKHADGYDVHYTTILDKKELYPNPEEQKITFKLSLKDIFPLHRFESDANQDELADDHILTILCDLTDLVAQLREYLDGHRERGYNIVDDSPGTLNRPSDSDEESDGDTGSSRSNSEPSEVSSQGSTYQLTDSDGEGD